jgi:hypothetical protein
MAYPLYRCIVGPEEIRSLGTKSRETFNPDITRRILAGSVQSRDREKPDLISNERQPHPKEVRHFRFVISAKAGIQEIFRRPFWIPAFAGMTS